MLGVGTKLGCILPHDRRLLQKLTKAVIRLRAFFYRLVVSVILALRNNTRYVPVVIIIGKVFIKVLQSFLDNEFLDVFFLVHKQ